MLFAKSFKSFNSDSFGLKAAGILGGLISLPLRLPLASALEEAQQNKHRLAESQVTKPGSGIDKTMDIFYVGAAYARANGDGF